MACSSALQPDYEAYSQGVCDYTGFVDFVLKEHPPKLRGIIPSSLPYKSEKEMATWVYGDSVDKTGKERPDLEGDEADMKKKRRRGMGEAEFDELWRAAYDICSFRCD